MMHHLLHVEEILLEIFDHCYESDHDLPQKNLVAIARTCKAFKEPALDVLWADLPDLSPLIRCLPGVSYVNSNGEYSLRRPLEHADWDIILGYTRRVRVVNVHGLCGLDVECVDELSNPPSTLTTIFPILCTLKMFAPDGDIFPFLRHLAGPMLTVLKFDIILGLGDAFDAFVERCPNITTFEFGRICTNAEVPDRILDLVYLWPKLRFVDCKDIVFSTAAFTHLSNLPDLNHLLLELDDTTPNHVPPIPSMLTFPALVSYELSTRSLATLRRYLDLSLPSIERLKLWLRHRLTGPELKLLLTALQTTCNHNTLVLISLLTSSPPGLPPYRINFHQLHPLTVFTNLQAIFLKLPYCVDLSEAELLQLTSSWPRLQIFMVGGNQRCTKSSAITPGGFVQLLQQCRSLYRFSFQFNTYGYTEIPQGHPWHGLEMPEEAIIDVQRSAIEEESIEALAAFFRVGPFPKFQLGFCLHECDRARASEQLSGQMKLYYERWERVLSLAHLLREPEQNARYVSKVLDPCAVYRAACMTMTRMLAPCIY